MMNLPKVKKIDLSSTNLSGKLPGFILPELEFIAISNTKLSGQLGTFGSNSLSLIDVNECQFKGDLPDFTPFNNIVVQLFNNKFTFKDLEPQIDNVYSMMYFNQDTVLPVIKSGNTLEVIAEGELNYYQWYKDSLIVNGGTSKTLTATDDGNYECLVLNEKLVHLSLRSEIVKIGEPTSVKESERKFSVYPNPSSGVININFSEPHQTQENIIIRDVNGKFVLETALISSNDLNLLRLPKGIYFIENNGSSEKVILE